MWAPTTENLPPANWRVEDLFRLQVAPLPHSSERRRSGANLRARRKLLPPQPSRPMAMASKRLDRHPFPVPQTGSSDLESPLRYRGERFSATWAGRASAKWFLFTGRIRRRIDLQLLAPRRHRASLDNTILYFKQTILAPAPPRRVDSAYSRDARSDKRTTTSLDL